MLTIWSKFNFFKCNFVYQEKNLRSKTAFIAIHGCHQIIIFQLRKISINGTTLHRHRHCNTRHSRSATFFRWFRGSCFSRNNCFICDDVAMSGDASFCFFVSERSMNHTLRFERRMTTLMNGKCKMEKNGQLNALLWINFKRKMFHDTTNASQAEASISLSLLLDDFRSGVLLMISALTKQQFGKNQK